MTQTRKEIQEYQRRWRAAHRDRVNAKARAYYAANLDKKRAIGRANYARHVEGARERRLRKKYGIALEDYRSMLSGQGGRCAICGTGDGGDHGQFCVDHDHETGKVRGVLCRKCNLAIGQLGNRQLLGAAARYLGEI